MAVNIPTIKDLYEDVLSNLEAELQINIPLFGRNFLRALAAVQAAKLKVQYLLIANLQKNIFIDTADSEAIGGTLERFGRVKLGRSPFNAVPGSYSCEVIGAAGATINASTTFKSDDDSQSPSKLFVIDNNYTLSVGTNFITLRALEGGTDSQLANGDTLTSTQPIIDVDSSVEVVSEVITPLNAESIEDYRAKGIEAYQLEPQGGAPGDYRIWSADAQGVKAIYPYAKIGSPAELNLFVEATIADSTDGKGTPPASMLTDVENVVEFDPDISKPLNERGRRPLTAFNIDFEPITVLDIDLEIANYKDLTPDIETVIENAITNELSDVRPFVAGADVLSDRNDVVSVNTMVYTIQDAIPRAQFDSLVLKVGGVVVTSKQFLNGDIPFLSSITYV